MSIRQDLATGERRALARPRKPGFVVPHLNEQGTHILYGRRDLHPAGQQVWLVDIEGRDDREVLNVGDAAKVSARWFPDGRRALVLAEHDTYRRLGVWDRVDGCLRWLIDDPARNLEGGLRARLAPTAPSPWSSRCATRAAGPPCCTWPPAPKRPLPAMPGTLIPQHPLGDDTWVGTYASAQQPADLVRFRLGDMSPSTPSLPGPCLGAHPPAPGRPGPRRGLPLAIRRRAGDPGLALPGAPSRRAALIVYIHGGPTAHSEDRLNAQIPFFVAQGFHVLDPNYRGSTGFGLAYPGGDQGRRLGRARARRHPQRH